MREIPIGHTDQHHRALGKVSCVIFCVRVWVAADAQECFLYCHASLAAKGVGLDFLSFRGSPLHSVRMGRLQTLQSDGK